MEGCTGRWMRQFLSVAMILGLWAVPHARGQGLYAMDWADVGSWWTVPDMKCVTQSCTGMLLLNDAGNGLKGCYVAASDAPAPECGGGCRYCGGSGNVNGCLPSAGDECEYPIHPTYQLCGLVYTNPCVYSASAPWEGQVHLLNIKRHRHHGLVRDRGRQSCSIALI